MGSDTNELDTRHEDKLRTEKRLDESENISENNYVRELTLNEVLDYCIVAGQSPLLPEGVIAYKELILSRYSALEEKVKELTTKLEVEHSEYQTIIAELEKENTDYKHAFDLLWEYCVKLEQQNAELKRQVEELTLEKYRMFFESVSCLFAEGTEFMTKIEIYESIKKEVKKLEQQSDNMTKSQREV
jgi:DNA repair exonuclease SbcCD ATPase subunit